MEHLISGIMNRTVCDSRSRDVLARSQLGGQQGWPLKRQGL